MWGARMRLSSSSSSSSRPLTAAAVAFVLVLAAVLPPSSWRGAVLHMSGWHGPDDDSGPIQAISTATEEEVKAVRELWKQAFLDKKN